MSHGGQPELQGRSALIDEWDDMLRRTPPGVRARVAEVARVHADRLAEQFYDTMLARPDAAALLSNELVRTRLSASLALWVRDLFAVDGPGLEAQTAHQLHIGEIHARIGVPLHLVMSGARLLARELVRALPQDDEPPGAHHHFYIWESIDLAIEAMSLAFVGGAIRSARAAESYRIHSMAQNMDMERERQRAALLDWAQTVLFELDEPSPGRLQRLTGSEFGLWLSHRGAAAFEHVPELTAIRDLVARVDDVVMPRLEVVRADEVESRRALTRELNQLLSEIKHLLSALFQAQADTDGARDVVTHLPNRRFLPTVLAREIAIHREMGTGFAVMQVDIDELRLMNERHGREGGDVILRGLTGIIGDLLGTGDFVFRIGGDDFLVILVECDVARAEAVAEAVRVRAESATFLMLDGAPVSVGVSIGLAMFDGHPDPDMLVMSSERALRAAKAAGGGTWRRGELGVR
ncbi:MAG: diguanylate cyclase [Thermoleophilia bacterium]